jgi:hypothetical protein
MDISLAGKWISPMHPEVVKDEPGTCDVCGMQLVRAETLGYVTAATDEKKPPLVIPHLAALVTGTRAIVYVELPGMHSAAEPALQTLSAVVRDGEPADIRSAFSAYSDMLDRPYDQPGTDYARELWNQYADRLGRQALDGQRARNQQEAEQILGQIEVIMSEAREPFAPLGQPTFEGREIVLGPRAGDYYLVRHGVEEGELVVTQGNFKIDAEIQIQAKPSMMTPEGGGGDGHDHGGHGDGAMKPDDPGHADHKMALPAGFSEQLRVLEAAYRAVSQAVREAELARINAAFKDFGKALAEIDGSELTGHPRRLWKEYQMLLENDVVEGNQARRLAEADDVYLLLARHMRRMREQLGTAPGQQRPIEHIVVAPEFQAQLVQVWLAYLAMQQALAADDFAKAGPALGGLESGLAAIDAQSLAGQALHVWRREQANLTKLLARLKETRDIKSMRTAFLPLSEEIGVLAKTFGFGSSESVFELHCPMAFEGRGGIWYQNSDQVRNPYYGATMLKCADRVEAITIDEPLESTQPGAHDHSH